VALKVTAHLTDNILFGSSTACNDLHMVYGPPDHLLLHLNSDRFNLSVVDLTRLSWKTGC